MSIRPAMNISAVERETGLGKDTLRVWERRYGFPSPARDANGERVYPAEQVERLRLMKRLIDQGHRPGRLLASSDAELAERCRVRTAPAAAGDDPTECLLAGTIQLIRQHDVAALQQSLGQAMMRLGLQRFVIELVAPLNRAVGEAWMNGQFEVYEEHLYTEQIKSLLRLAIGNLPAGSGRPRILLTTVPDEAHALGLLMVQALLALDGANCISLGTQTPVFDIERAATAHQADVVALSFSAAFPARQLATVASQLRQLLPASIALWLGGSGVQRLPPQPGVVLLASLQEAVDALASWRNGGTAGN
ncbi:MAG TPA: MerR family transcriptional regulator [Candidatus Accumulibacter phosphatis]|jgi:methanogenic corrinoid protein MtbC1|nr:MAG: transcriptional regulator MirA [Candidatus Accumulibacter sp. SK-11]HAY27385.1 MerR family DNA-binding transcriptional regulator [Accumulibacter sp.]HCV13493.1 MerR family DNA-binding transcriptional regulator [Accumulibacter sp.]HRL78630.1 MerR family transcriptional regulator [Candidatus Accumulibacter phosphatis]HRQ97628.1 MerR family transcriptional regulator [Candidatus Accumulibacter phosphatis]